MKDQAIEQFVGEIADRVPAPGGGATAALIVAQGAALVAMVGRYSDGDRYPTSPNRDCVGRRSGRRAVAAGAETCRSRPRGLAFTTVGLAARLVPIGNRNLVADLAAAAHAARAGAGISLVNIELNLGGISDGVVRAVALRRSRPAKTLSPPPTK